LGKLQSRFPKVVFLVAKTGDTEMFRRALIATGWLLATASAASADLLWGVSGHPLTAYPGVSIERQLDYVEDLGMKSYRVNIVDTSSGDRLAELVAAGKKRGIEILPVITPGGISLDKDGTDELYSKAWALAVALGSRFKNDIRVWELGNEMENYAIIKPCERRDDGTTYPCEWGPAGGVGALDYYGPRWVKVSAVLKGLSEGIAEVDPGIRMAIGTAGWGHLGAFERMKRDGINWDISVWHMYGEDPEESFDKIASYGKPIWVTELNHPYGSQQSEQQHAEGLMKAMKRLRELQDKYKVEAAHIYELLDETYWAPSFEAHMGLVRLVGSTESGWSAAGPKPGYVAVRGMIRGPRELLRPQRDCDLRSLPNTGSQSWHGGRGSVGGSPGERRNRRSRHDAGPHEIRGIQCAVLHDRPDGPRLCQFPLPPACRPRSRPTWTPHLHQAAARRFADAGERGIRHDDLERIPGQVLCPSQC
jgi:hypothetical protein